MAEKVIVIGAGLSGLSAAKKLAPHHQVQILEARSRIGGRTWSSDLAGHAIDMGASWIHGAHKGNPARILADNAKLPLYESNYSSAARYQNGSKLQSLDKKHIKGFFSQIYHQAETSGKSLAEVLDSYSAKHHHLPRDWQQFLAVATIEHEYAADLQDLSFSSINEGLDAKGPDVLIKHGYQEIVDSLSSGLEISLNTQVTEIKWDKSQVLIETSKGTFTADRVIVSVPLGVLKNNTINFTPDLPARMKDAISALGVGTLNKIWIKFPYTFWPKESHFLHRISPMQREFPEWLNAYELYDDSVLAGFVAGSKAEEMERNNDEKILEIAMSSLRDMFGNDIPAPEAFKVTRWKSDPHSLGSYSYLPIGISAKERSAFHRPLKNRVFFAGEHSNLQYPATTHGAILSGERAAKNILSLSGYP